MNECRTITADPSVPYAVLLAPVSPATENRIQIDHTARVDCDNQGITILTSVWSIVFDEDSDLTLSQEAITGLWTSVLVAGHLDTKPYQIRNTITTSDGRTLTLDFEWRCTETKSQLRAA